MAATQYFRQLGTGRIYPRPNNAEKHPGILLRKDIVPFDPEKARRRIEANKRIIEDSKSKQTPEAMAAHQAEVADLQSVSNELTSTENAIDAIQEQNLQQDPGDQKPPPQTTQDMEAERRADTLEKDVEIIMIKGMRKTKSVANYVEREFGEDLPADVEDDLEKAKDFALNLRANRIFEVDR